MIAIIIIIVLIICGVLSFFGCRMCIDDNALGLILLFFGLNLLGLIIGICLLYNNKNKSDNNYQYQDNNQTETDNQTHNHDWTQKEYNQQIKIMTY
ncbi:MAG: hypothetical protein REH79_01690 [Spiroplasma sp.]|nr:hypothetical protein [Spiroplasma sp.]